jgi:hypothetical protein
LISFRCWFLLPAATNYKVWKKVHSISVFDWSDRTKLVLWETSFQPESNFEKQHLSREGMLNKWRKEFVLFDDWKRINSLSIFVMFDICNKITKNCFFYSKNKRLRTEFVVRRDWNGRSDLSNKIWWRFNTISSKYTIWIHNCSETSTTKKYILDSESNFVFCTQWGRNTNSMGKYTNVSGLDASKKSRRISLLLFSIRLFKSSLKYLCISL